VNIGCPFHWPDLYLCDLSCLKTRMDFLRAAAALRDYWRERAREREEDAAREQQRLHQEVA
jgi:hypothetical protein